MEKEIQRTPVEKLISFPEVRQLAEAKTPAICSPTSKSYSSMLIIKIKKIKVKSICKTGGPQSALISTQASSGKTGSNGADAQALPKSLHLNLIGKLTVIFVEVITSKCL